METAFIKTPLGMAKLKWDNHGLSSFTIIGNQENNDCIDFGPISEPLQDAISQIKEYFEGKRQVFDIKLNPDGTDFQKKVWQALLQIPFGRTASYLELSKILGDRKAIRAVAAANGKNPLWIIVPCHRVIGSDGSLTGYAGGLNLKKWLLEHESPVRQQSLF